jgi:phage-related protein
MDKPIIWLAGVVATPPFSKEARIEAGYLLRSLQKGQKLSLPHSRPMPSIGRACHELRINDATKSWRIVYVLEDDAVIVLDVFEKKTEQTPIKVVESCKRRLKAYYADGG